MFNGIRESLRNGHMIYFDASGVCFGIDVIDLAHILY